MLLRTETGRLKLKNLLFMQVMACYVRNIYKEQEVTKFNLALANIISYT